jgi:hypothetical protein
MPKRIRHRTGTALVPISMARLNSATQIDDALASGMAAIVAAFTATESENAEADRADETTRALLARLNQLWVQPSENQSL